MNSIRVIILLAAGFFLYAPGYAQGPLKMGVQKGRIDLRKINNFNEPISLDGNWGFFWKQLLAADSFPEPPRYIPFPSLWSENSLGGKPLPSQGYASYTLTVL
ncbi:MAG TPA: hypothetical protein VGZ71_05530, partial [Puia sp.]|nr:hypothetical protein [Puia sp.]